MNEPRKRGRPTGSTTFDPDLACAFGAAVVSLRAAAGLSQEALAANAGVERSHMGKLERGEHLPNLVGFFKIAAALGCSAAQLMTSVENNLLGPST
jgi:transcriptional regulator with XRE-family HTH domain